jgi:hypothetical protein
MVFMNVEVEVSTDDVIDEMTGIEKEQLVADLVAEGYGRMVENPNDQISEYVKNTLYRINTLGLDADKSATDVLNELLELIEGA